MLSDSAQSSFHARQCGDVDELVWNTVTTHHANCKGNCMKELQIKGRHQELDDEESRVVPGRYSELSMSSTECSIGTSSEYFTSSSSKRSYDDLAVPYATDNTEDESDLVIEAPVHIKKRRSAQVPELAEKKKRREVDLINKKMRALQDLVPNCNKVDDVLMLDEAIEYLKTLQSQLQAILLSRMHQDLCPFPLMTPLTLLQCQTPYQYFFGGIPSFLTQSVPVTMQLEHLPFGHLSWLNSMNP